MAVLKYWDGTQYVALSGGGGGGPTSLDDLTDVVMTAPTFNEVLTYNGTNWVNAAAPSGGGGGSGGTVGATGRYVIAAPGAGLGAGEADLDLGTVTGSIATALQNALNANPKVYIVGPSIQLDNSVVVSNSVDILSDGTKIIGHASLDSWAGGNSRLAIFKVQGSETNSITNPFSANQTKGSRTLTFNVAHGLAVGDYFRIRTNEVRNVNRSYYYKGELNRVQKVVSSTVIEIEVPLRDTYTVSGYSMNTFKINMLHNVRLEGLVFECHASALKRQEMVTIQWCVQPKIVNCKVYGGANKRAGIGFALSKCIGGVIDNCYAYEIMDNYPIGDSSVTDNSRNGYGFYVGGSENSIVSNCFAHRCRHGYDVNNYGASTWPPSRYTTFINCVGYQTNQPPFTTHDAEGVTYTNCNATGCSGGFHLRGEDFSLTDCSVIEPTNTYHAENGAGSQNGSNDTVGALQIGEADYTSNAQGWAGHRLNVKNFRLDNNNTAYATAGFFSRDPIKDAYVQMVVTPTRRGVYLQGDYVENSKFDITIHGEKQNSGYGGFIFAPQTNSTTAAQYFANNEVTVHADQLRGTAIDIAGGVRGGVSKHNVFNLNIPQLAAGISTSAPQIKFNTGTHGKQYLNKIFADMCYENSILSNSGGATVIKGTFNSYKTLTLENWPIVVNYTQAYSANISGTNNESITCEVPGGAQNGDYLLAVWINQSGSGLPSAANLVPASGFSPVGPAQVWSSGAARFTQFYGKQVTSTPESPSTWAFTPGATYTAFRHGIIMLLLRGHVPLSVVGFPTTVASADGTNSGASGTPTTVTPFSSFTTSSNNALVISAAHTTVGSGIDASVITPAGYSEEASLVVSYNPTTQSSEYLTVLSKPVVTAGTVAAVTANLAGTAVDDCTISIALAG